jgi:hypothetical protein
MSIIYVCVEVYNTHPVWYVTNLVLLQKGMISFKLIP